MKRINIILPPSLPFPPIKGGAVETLLDLFIDENEKYNKYRIKVFSIYDSEAERESKKNVNTEVCYIKVTKNTYKRYRLCKFIQKVCGVRLNFLDEYNRLILENIRNTYKPDLCIIEGGNYRDYINISRYIGVNRMAIHVHGVSTPRFDPTCIYNHFIFVSTCAKEYWEKKTKCNSFVLTNAVNEEKFNCDKDLNAEIVLKNKLEICKDDFVVLYCGRLVEIKGVLELIKAVNQINNKKIKLVIVGSSNFAGAEITEYQRVLQENLSEKVVFTGFIKNEDIPLYYKICDIVASPSICMEAASLVNVEAMMCGKCILTTSQGGNPEYVNPMGSVMIDYDGNKDKLIRDIKLNILKLIDNPAIIERMEASNRIYSKRFNKKNYYENYSKIIDSCI